MNVPDDLPRAYLAQNETILTLRSSLKLCVAAIDDVRLRLAETRELVSGEALAGATTAAETIAPRGLTLPYDGDPCSCELCADAEATLWLVNRKAAICEGCCCRELERMLQGVCQREAATTIRLEAKIEALETRLKALDRPGIF